MARLKCPECSHVFAPDGSGAPKCPQCGYRAEGGSPTPSFSQGGTPGNPAPYPSTPPGGAPTATASGQAGFQTAGQPSAHWASVTSMVLGILGFIGPFFMLAGGPLAIGGILFGVGAIVLGSVGINAANTDPANVGGKGMAVAGLVLGIIQVALFLLGLLFFFLVLRVIFGEFVVLAASAGI